MSYTERLVSTERLDTNVREAGDPANPTVVLIHGNVSSGAFFDRLIVGLADRFHVIAPDFRGYGGSERKTIDATRGMRDFSDDLHALIETMGLPTPLHLLGWSAGGGVVMQYAIDHPGNVASVVLEAGMSPYGFGGSRGLDGALTFDDGAGSGGGTANPDFVRLLGEGDRSADSPVTPLNTLRAFYVKPGLVFEDGAEDRYLDSMLDTKVGDDIYPGDMTVSENWPGVAPGVTGMNNALSPRYTDLSAFGAIRPAPPVLWIRGDADQIVSDTSFFDFGYLGELGFVPGWPGADVYPPQPMVSQLRTVLEQGDNFTELVYDNCGHSPHLEHPDRFLSDVTTFWS